MGRYEHKVSLSKEFKGFGSSPIFSDLGAVFKKILSNAEEGLFFLNESFEIYKHYAQSLEQIIGLHKLEGKNFIDLLENRVPSQVIKNTKEFLTLMFRKDLDEEIIKELNPLNETEFFYEDEWGIWTSSKYLSFKFKRIFSEEKIESLIAIVQDVSEKIQLNQQLKQTEERTQKQMEWLVNILHVEPDMLKDFFIGVEQELVRIEEILKNAKDPNTHREIIENIYRSLFIIKGNASLLDLRFFTDKTNQFIDKLLKLKHAKHLSGTDFVPIVVSLGEMRDTLLEVQTIFKRISHFHNHFRLKRSFESELLVQSLKNLIKSLTKQLNKHVEFDYKDFDAFSIPYTYRQLVRDILFLLVRNTILYGIEGIDQRRSKNKNPNASIKISSVIQNGFLGLVLRHDGRIDRIERTIQNMISTEISEGGLEKSAEGMQVMNLLYTPNLQNEDENEIIENYSMDMELLKRKLKEKGGRLKITFTSEEHCEFVVLLPLKKISISTHNLSG